jgi:anion-transporting  ArsA/GET3 family ATPase
MVDGFRERAKRVNELLADPSTCFMIVCGPQGEPIEEAVFFHRKLVEAKLPVGGVIVNKVHYETRRPPARRRPTEGLIGPPAARVASTADTRHSPRDACNVEHSNELAPRSSASPHGRDIHDSRSEDRQALFASGGNGSSFAR